LKELIIPDQYRNYKPTELTEENFLLIDSGTGTDRFLAFGREAFAAWFGQVKTVYVDGTFRQAPPLFTQIFVVLGERHGFVFPLLYCLLPNKQRRTYERLFEAIVALCPQFVPESISMDFEIAVIQAVQVYIHRYLQIPIDFLSNNQILLNYGI
jgi:hypothetical protein